MSSFNPTMTAGEDAYESKASEYFGGVRRDFVQRLQQNPDGAVLEVGCGHGATGKLALEEGKCARYCAVEMSRTAASEAAKHLTEVVVGDVEQMDLPWADASFDAVLLSEVLEHLADPAATLRKLRRVLKPNALVLASSPNVAHYSIILMLIRGRWDLMDSGPMDRTHLRWFTPRSYQQMFEAEGYQVVSVKPMRPFGWKARLLTSLMFGAGTWLFQRQIVLEAIRSA